MSNSEDTIKSPTPNAVAKENNSAGNGQQFGGKRLLSTPKSPLKIDQQKRRDEQELEKQVCIKSFFVSFYRFNKNNQT